MGNVDGMCLCFLPIALDHVLVDHVCGYKYLCLRQPWVDVVNVLLLILSLLSCECVSVCV